MITYHLNQTGDIIGYSAMSNHTMNMGASSIVREQPLSDYLNYYYDGSDFIERENIPYSIDKAVIETNETAIINVPAGANVIIIGPGLMVDDISDGPIEFSSERAGVFKFQLILSPFKLTQFEIEVR